MVLKVAQFFRRLHREEEGFTLIELLIVIAILAVLAAIAIPLVVNRISEARDAADEANVAQLQSAVDLYLLDKADSKPSLTGLSTGKSLPYAGSWMKELVDSGYLQKEVKSPNSGKCYELETKGANLRVVISDAPA